MQIGERKRGGTERREDKQLKIESEVSHQHCGPVFDGEFLFWLDYIIHSDLSLAIDESEENARTMNSLIHIEVGGA